MNQEKQTLIGGQILESHWGYGMTCIDYYLVLQGAEFGKFAKIVKIRQDNRADGFLCGTTVPTIPLVPVGEAFKKKVNKWGEVRINTYATASVWDGKPNQYNHCD